MTPAPGPYNFSHDLGICIARTTKIKMAEKRTLILCSLFCLACLCHRASGYFVNVDAHAQECFFDRVSSGMKMSLTFEVVEGGFLDIDVKVMEGICEVLLAWEKGIVRVWCFMEVFLFLTDSR